MKVKILSMFAVLILFFSIFPLQAKAVSNSVLVDKVWTEPAVIEPGQQFKLNFTLKNAATRDLEKLLVKLVSIEGKDTLTGFSPVGGTNDIYCSSIKKDKSKTLSINLLADTQLKAGAYNLVVSISGKEKYRTPFEENKIIGIIINNKPNPLITSFDIEDGETDEAKMLKLDFVNSGMGSLSNVLVTVTAGDKKHSKFYGTVEPTDENSFEQGLKVNEDIKGQVEITFADELNRKGSLKKDFSITVPHQEALAAVKEEKQNSGFFSSIGKFFKRLFGLGE
jgi:hypothetical protein